MSESVPGPTLADPGDLAKLIDHTLLKPDARQADIRRYCEEARAHRFRSVCVNAVHAALVHEALAGSDVLTCVVVGFPLGAMSHKVKALEAAQAVADGADEIDMVIDIGALKDGRHDAVRADIAGVKRACGKALLKVIIETCLLTDAEKIAACKLAVEAGADFVKTSTGFSTGGATEADVALMRATVGPKIGVKASGGVRSFEDARLMVAAGANRIGTSNGVALVSGLQAGPGY